MWRGLQPAASRLVSTRLLHCANDSTSRHECRDGSLERLRHEVEYALRVPHDEKPGLWDAAEQVFGQHVSALGQALRSQQIGFAGLQGLADEGLNALDRSGLRPVQAPPAQGGQIALGLADAAVDGLVVLLLLFGREELLEFRDRWGRGGSGTGSTGSGVLGIRRLGGGGSLGTCTGGCSLRSGVSGGSSGGGGTEVSSGLAVAGWVIGPGAEMAGGGGGAGIVLGDLRNSRQAGDPAASSKANPRRTDLLCICLSLADYQEAPLCRSTGSAAGRSSPRPARW